MNKRIVIISISALFTVVAACLLVKNGGAPDVHWATAPAERGDIRIEITATGAVNPVKTVEVGTQVSGVISKLYVDFNSIVKQGQVIAVLDTTSLAAAVLEAKAGLKSARIKADRARREVDRKRQLFKDKIVATVDYDNASDDYEIAAAELSSARAKYERAVINLQYATITAPISGVVISKNVDIGQTVAASFNTPTLFTIANDLTKMQIDASIDEADIGQIKEGQSVAFGVDAFPDDQFKGAVRQVRLQPSKEQNVVSYTVVIDVPNPDMKLLPGMTADLTVIIDERRDVLKIPNKALRFRPPLEIAEKYLKKPDGPAPMGPEGGAFGPEKNRPPGKDNPRAVWVKSGDGIRFMPVRTGLSDGIYTELLSHALKNGDQVLVGTAAESTVMKSSKRSPFMPGPPPGRR